MIYNSIASIVHLDLNELRLAEKFNIHSINESYDRYRLCSYMMAEKNNSYAYNSIYNSYSKPISIDNESLVMNVRISNVINILRQIEETNKNYIVLPFFGNQICFIDKNNVQKNIILKNEQFHFKDLTKILEESIVSDPSTKEAIDLLSDKPSYTFLAPISLIGEEHIYIAIGSI